MPNPDAANLDQIVARSGYPMDAFIFVRRGLDHTVQKLRPNHEQMTEAERHVSGQELSQGIREFAVTQYGLMARTVLRRMKINTTEDIGQIVFAMVNGGFMQATEHDSVADFNNVFSFDTAFDVSIPVDQVPEEGFEPDPVHKV
ncbi:MAG: hypothetical protein GC159_00740 [Phycisphaera sp.]|nr:hypothetical protein [Phycisphaera sp.]